MKDVFIIGCKGIPANYGGFETFTQALIEKRKSEIIRYHVACMNLEEQAKADEEYCGSRLYYVNVNSKLGPAKVIAYDLKAMEMALDYIEEHHILEPIFYMLGCTAGPFMNYLYKRFDKYHVKFLINVDGHEWKRAKWAKPIQWYLKYSEEVIVKHSDLVISDSIGIENYILSEYRHFDPKSKFIAYGADLPNEGYGIDKLDALYEWYKKFDIINGQYYLIVGRFVPENNYETMIKEFMKSKTNKKLVIITNVEQNRFYKKLLKKTHFDTDSRIVFAGTVYDSKLLYLIRKNAYGYIHGHEVGGTNPSLLEALASTNLNLLYDVDFNSSVGLDAAYYFNKDEGNLASLIDSLEYLSEEEMIKLGDKAKKRILEAYSWDFIIDEYENTFNGL